MSESNPSSAQLKKPAFGSLCNSCGFCCAKEPCALAQEFLNCSTGPCVALEQRDGRTVCGLVRNPLGYLFAAVQPGVIEPALQDPADVPAGHELSVRFASALGLGKGCDADDDAESAAWVLKIPTQAG